MKNCPFCAESIQDEATKCRFCGEWLDKKGISSKVSETVKKDVKNAEYSDTYLGFGSRLPTAGKSITGWIFIAVGAALGGLVCLLLAFILFSVFDIKSKISGAFFFAIFLFFVCAGGALGQGKHEAMRKKLE